MEPRIQYAGAGHGVNAAHWTMCEGETLGIMPVLRFSHCQGECQ